MHAPHHDCHHHGLGHSHGPVDYNRAFAIGVVLNVVYILFEAGFGIYHSSLALLADAGHNLSDVLGLVMAWGAHYLGRVKPTREKTYGWRSSSIIAALGNAILLLIAMGAILWEAVGRISSPQPVPGGVVMWVAALGVVINTATALLFMRGRHRDINIRGAYLHMAADAAVSLAVVIGGAAMMLWQWAWLDPVLSISIALVILLGTWDLFRESLHLSLHGVPRGIDAGRVLEFLRSRPWVVEVHDFHIWAMSTTESAMTAHVVMPDLSLEESDRFLFDVAAELEQEFHISHATIQVERSIQSDSCRLSAAGSV